MGTICKKLHGLTRAGRRLGLAAAGLGLGLVLPAQPASPTQPLPVKVANDFATVEYYDFPWAMQIKSRLSGAQAVPQAEHVVLVRQLRLEFFATNGLPEYVVTAPECRYDQIAGTASSSGPLQVHRPDGKVTITGRGFCWQQDGELLTISNEDVTILQTGAKSFLIP